MKKIKQEPVPGKIKKKITSTRIGTQENYLINKELSAELLRPAGFST